MSSNVFGFPIVAPSITLTDAAGLVTDAVTAEVVTASVGVVTELVGSADPAAGSGTAGPDLQLSSADGASSASTAGGKGGDLELFAGNAGAGTAAANGGSVILQPGSGFAPGVSGLVRVTNGPLITNGALVNLGAGTPVAITPDQLRSGFLFGTPGALSTYNVPNAASLVQNFPGIQLGDAIRFSVANLSGANAINMGGAAAAVGGIQIAANQSGAFALIATNVSSGTEAFTLYRVAS